MIFPRLEYGTVVDDDGRPRAVSLSIAALTVLAVSVTAGLFADTPALVTSVGLITGSLVAGLALLDRDRFGSLFVGTLLTVPVGTVFAGWTASRLFGAESGVATTGIGIAVLGIGLSWAGFDGRDAVETAVDRIAVGYAGIIAGGLVPLALYGVFLLVRVLLRPSTDGFGSPVAVPIAATLLGGAVYLAARTFPFAPLAPRERRSGVAKRVASVRRLAAVAVILAVALTVVAASSPAVGALVRPLSTPVVVWPAVLAGGVLFGLVCLTAALERVSRDRGVQSRRRVAAVLAGAFVGVVLLTLPLPSSLLAVVVLVLLVGPVVLIVAAVLFGLAIHFGLVPERAGGLTLACAGLAVVTVGGALAAFPAPFVFAAAAGTVVVWDVSVYGMGVTAELGHVPETRRLELVHAVVAVSVGVAAAAAATLLFALRTTAGVGTTVTSAMAVAVVAALVASLPLRG